MSKKIIFCVNNHLSSPYLLHSITHYNKNITIMLIILLKIIFLDLSEIKFEIQSNILIYKINMLVQRTLPSFDKCDSFHLNSNEYCLNNKRPDELTYGLHIYYLLIQIVPFTSMILRHMRTFFLYLVGNSWQFSF